MCVMVHLYNLSIEYVIVNFSRIDLSILSVNFSYVCFIYAEIFEKMSSGGLEVSFSIYDSHSHTG